MFKRARTIAAAIACLLAVPAVAMAQVQDGVWAGTTNQGKDYKITVQSGSSCAGSTSPCITQIEFAAAIGGCSSRSAVRVTPATRIDNNAFSLSNSSCPTSYTHSGTFIPAAQTASGTLLLSCFCSGSLSLTWNASLTSLPSIDSFSPTSGTVGTLVTITGFRFSGATAVLFGGVTASSFSVVSDKRIDVSVPAGATTGPVSVVTPGGTATSVSSFQVTQALAINNAFRTEGDTGTSNMVFQVTLSTSASQTVTVDYATADGTAVAGADYVATSGTLTFLPGVMNGLINVPIIGDTLAEDNETFTVTLSHPVNAGFNSSVATGTIMDDDPPPTISVGNVSVNEGNTGQTPAVFNVSLSTASGRTVTVAYATAAGTATAGADFMAVSGTLSFAPGVTSQPVSVGVLGDRIYEGNETFSLVLSNPTNAALGASSGTGTILDDDPQGLSIDDVSAKKLAGATATFTVTLSPASAGTVTVDYATADDTAKAPGDYQARSGTLTFAPGITTQQIAVPLVPGGVPAPKKRFLVNLSNASGAAIAYAQGAGTILDVRRLGDFDGDGASDILWRATGGSATGALFVWLMNGKDIKGATYLDPISADWVIQAVGDFNGDGKADILWRNMNAQSTDAGKLYIWMMDGPKVIAGTGYPNSQADFTWEVQGVGDLDGDGKSDIVWRAVSGTAKGAMFLWLMDGKNIKGATYLNPISTDWVIQAVGDLSGDGKADILWRNMTPGQGDSGYLYLWVMDGASVVGGTGYPNSNADFDWAVQAIGDLDGDGKQDIVWRAVNGTAKGAMFLWLMDGKTIKGATYLDPISTDWVVQGTGDFNGDGKADILWRNVNAAAPDAGYLYVWLMDGSKVAAGTGYPNSQAGFEWVVQAP